MSKPAQGNRPRGTAEKRFERTDAVFAAIHLADHYRLLVVVVLMGIIGNVIPLATGVMTDTLAGNPVPFEHSSAPHDRVLVPGLTGSALSRSIPYYQPDSRGTLGIYCLIVIVCVAIKGFLSFTARWTLIGVSRDIEFDIRNDLLKRLLLLEPEFYVRNRTGELMSRATNDLNAVRMVLGPGIMYSATTIVTMILAIAVMVALVAFVDAVGAAAGAGGGGGGVVLRADDS